MIGQGAATRRAKGKAILTEDDRTNEHLKLLANWLNALATAVMAAGTFVPAANFLYDFLPKIAEP
jgi:hypothetical protein